jgi:tRNA(Ile)-lysidine synthase
MDIDVKLPAGKYIAAVSGGVDSVVLLDLLAKQKDLELVVAHFDHGMRKDSAKDDELVRKLALKYKCKFEHEKGNLNIDASEAEARNKRYVFLNGVKQKYIAKAIITAHHQDDLIETSMINLLRGTGRRGLTSLKSRDGYLRPLLIYPKKELIKYARANKLAWNEDTTNRDIKILRNYLRLKIIPKMIEKQRQTWLDFLNNAQVVNNKLDTEIQNLLKKGLHKGQPVLRRSWFIMLPHDISKEVLLTILYNLGAQDIDKKSIERLSVQIKTLPAGKVLQTVGIDILLTKRSARFKWR